MTILNENQCKLIYQRILLNGKTLVLLLDKYGKENISFSDLNANIYCIDDSFNIIWQIDPEPTKFEEDPFTYIEKNEQGEIQAGRFSGFEYKIDIATGKAKIIGWDK